MGTTDNGNVRVAFGRIAAVVAGVATLLALTACTKGSTTGPPQTSTTATSTSATSTSATSTTTSANPSSSGVPKADFSNTAIGMIDAISRGDFGAATVDFDSGMKQKLPASELSTKWASYQQQLGNYQSHGDPQEVTRGDETVVNVPLKMQKAPGQFRVNFRNKDGKVSGLGFLKAAEPAPSG
jgi:Protein of unknown function (DUF3887)